MMTDADLNTFQLRILLRTLREKLGTKRFEAEHLMKALTGDMILPKFGEYNYYYETERNF